MRRTTSLVACLIALAPASLAWSQQQPATQPLRPQTQNEDQPRSETQRRGGAPGEQSERGGAAGERGVSQLATILALGNQAEIELGQLAAQKTSNESVRGFAAKMVEDHTAYLQKLQQFNPQLAAANRNQAGSESAGERGERGERRQTPIGQAPAGQPAAGQPAAGQPAAGGRGAGSDQATEGRMGQMGLLPVIREAAQTRLQMTKQALSQHEGQDFDMGYLGHQIYAHMDMLAHLQAMQGKGSPEFQQVVQQGVQTTEQHLEMAKTMAKQLEDNEGGQSRPQSSPTTRPAQPNAQ